MKRSLFTCLLSLSVCSIFAQTLFINEIHYDNLSIDEGEGIEIAGIAGTSLEGFKLIGYNGYNGLAYSTLDLGGTIPDQQNGYGTLWFDFASLQNGEPDGIVLVNATSEVIQFLSYEGSFTAIGGPADGLISADIGTSETSSTPSGYSLQLNGTGNSYDNFSWSGPDPGTKGLVNSNQTFMAERSMNILTPTGGETYEVGNTIPITWSSSNIEFILIGGFDHTKNEFFILPDEPGGEPLMIEATKGEFSFIIPNSLSTDEIDLIIYDASDTSFKKIVTPLYILDNTPPSLIENLPGIAELNVSTDVSPLAFFDEEIFEGTGMVVIRNEDHTIFESFSINRKGTLQIEGNMLTINPDAEFSTGSKYYIEIEPGVVTDFRNNSFEGLVGNEKWFFTTQKSSDATLADIKIDGISVDNFYPNTYNYNTVLAQGATGAPGITAIPSNEFAIVTINNASDITGTVAERTATIDVVSQDLGSANNYTVTFELATLISTPSSKEIKIFPVPAREEIIIQNISGYNSLEISDLTAKSFGRISLSGEDEFRLHINHFPQGIYFIILKSEADTYILKFVKIR